MNKFFALKKQVPLCAAARYLSNVLEEEVTEADVLYHGLEGHLQLSVFFVNGVNAHPCKLIPKTAPPLTYEESLGVHRTYFNDKLNADIYFCSETVLKGIYELPLVGTSHDYIKDVYQKMVDGPRVNLDNTNGSFVYMDSSYYELCEWPGEDDYDPRGLDTISFPEDSWIVVRPSELEKFVTSFYSPENTKHRHDAMSVEINKIIQELKTEGSEVSPSHVWQKLIERCGREDSCSAVWRHEASETNNKPTILWFGVDGNRRELTLRALKERLRRQRHGKDTVRAR